MTCLTTALGKKKGKYKSMYQMENQVYNTEMTPLLTSSHSEADFGNRAN